MIDHRILDVYEAAAGDPDQVPAPHRKYLGSDWTLLDELLLDLHMIKHGYTSAGYERHVERRLLETCADPGVVERIRNLRL